MKSFSKIFQQTFWQVLGKIVTSISTLIILGLVARNYGEVGTGIYTLALTYLGIFYLLADFGFNAHVLQKLTGNSEQITVKWQKLLGVRLVWGLVLIVLALLLLPILPFNTPELSWAIIFGVLAITSSAVYTTANLIFQSKLRYDLSVFASIMGTVLGFGFFIYLILQKYPPQSLMLAHMFSWLIIATTSLFFLKKFLSRITPLFDLDYVKDLFKQSWPIALTLTLNVIYFRIDSFLLAYFKTVSDVGIYNIAYSVFQSALVLPSFIMNAYYPLMIKSLTEARKVALALLVLALLGVGATIFLAPLIIDLLTGQGFKGSEDCLKILSLGYPAFFLSALLMWIFVTKGWYKRMLVIYTLGLFFNLGLNLTLIPSYSYIGASWATVISEYFILLLQVVFLVFRRP